MSATLPPAFDCGAPSEGAESVLVSGAPPGQVDAVP
jgi:hypothetical protein